MLMEQSKPGDQLKRLRAHAGLTSREVAERSGRIAATCRNPGYLISHARLVQIETGTSMPSIYKLLALSAIYGVAIESLMSTPLRADRIQGLHYVSADPPWFHCADRRDAESVPAQPVSDGIRPADLSDRVAVRLALLLVRDQRQDADGDPVSPVGLQYPPVRASAGGRDRGEGHGCGGPAGGRQERRCGPEWRAKRQKRADGAHAGIARQGAIPIRASRRQAVLRLHERTE
jgi:transcriptional regulator with XRE-family HTH domain